MVHAQWHFVPSSPGVGATPGRVRRIIIITESCSGLEDESERPSAPDRSDSKEVWLQRFS
eukprot:1021971-Rhodomonas_salina.1